MTPEEKAVIEAAERWSADHSHDRELVEAIQDLQASRAAQSQRWVADTEYFHPARPIITDRNMECSNITFSGVDLRDLVLRLLNEHEAQR